jgi:hypothetical protein
MVLAWYCKLGRMVSFRNRAIFIHAERTSSNVLLMAIGLHMVVEQKNIVFILKH